ncbi:hypothetical protein D3C85_1333930 [compost metagenome]
MEQARHQLAALLRPDHQVTPAVMPEVPIAGHLAGDVDGGRNHGACQRRLQPIRIVDAVLQGHNQRFALEVAADLVGNLLRVNGFHADQHDIGVLHGRRMGACRDAHLFIEL